MPWSNRFSKVARDIKTSEIRELLKLLADPEILSFAGGIPDPALFPLDAVKRIEAEIAADDARHRAALQYAPTEGYVPLRQWVADRAKAPDFTFEPRDVLITNGAQQGLTLLASALIDEGDAIAVAEPSYLGALQVFKTKGPKFLTVETDADGLRPEALEAVLQQGPRFLYTIPDFQNPGGMTLSAERRQRIVEMAHHHGVPVLEDTAYRALYYDAPPPPTLLEMETNMLADAGRGESWRESGLVVQLGTASKTLAPSLRIGWTLAPQPLIEKLVVLKQADDLNTSSLNQMLAHGLATTILDEHVVTLRRAYGERRDAMVEALHRNLPNDASFTAPEGGMFCWVTLPDGIDTAELLKLSVAEAKIAFVPGAAFHANGGGANTLRMSFSTCSPDDIRMGVEKLCALVRREMA